MREIKFRYYFKCKTLGYIHRVEYNLSQIEERPTKKLSVLFDEEDYEFLGRCQFTGLYAAKFCKGTEIYEGDIIKAHHDFGPGGMHERIAQVHFDNRRGYQWEYWDLDTIAVVGNIYETPELLDK
ncbi:YopX protein [Exiguobacterium phage vB_EauM-23]|nr:YopX protein [Exiguobacterium phage vB_EauM-23]